ncbi:MAG: Gfo/Idh/MocA family oxidoreductase [Deltaproteobacteria bacterium]|nr:Gfo/Idh/MocA family oxidoreductase [Deltaproteobacteria bacterium]
MTNDKTLPLKGAIIGFGNVAEKAHIPALAADERFRIVAVADPLGERRQQAQAILPHVRVYEHAGQLLAAEAALDFVDICTTPQDHSPLALAALRQGLHVLCEKPLTLELENFIYLKEAAHQAGRALVTVHNWRYAPLLARAADLVKNGLIGKLTMVEWEVHRTSGGGGGLTNWRQEGGQALGGILIDHGWHAFYLLMMWAGAAPTALNARLAFSDDRNGIEHEAELGLRFPASQGRLFMTWRAEERRNLGRLSGQAGEIVMADDRLLIAPVDRPAETMSFPAKVSAGSHHPDWMGGVLQEFLAEIADPGLRGRNLEEAELCARLIRLAYLSHQHGGSWVDL